MIDNNRILIIDDNEPIHQDYDKALLPRSGTGKDLRALESRLFDDPMPQPTLEAEFRLVHVFSGMEGIQKVEESRKQMDPFALAFVDERMPPGIDGIETVKKIWEIDPHIEIVICTAFSDYSWREILAIFGMTDKLLILKKPFDIIEVKQISLALMKKWNLARDNRVFKREMERLVSGQTALILSLFQFANELHTFTRKEEMGIYLLNTLKQFTYSNRVILLLPEEKNKHLEIYNALGLDKETEKKLKIPLEIMDRCPQFQLKKPMIVNNPEEISSCCLLPELGDLFNNAFICAPIVGKKGPLGIIILTDREEDTPFTKQDEDVVSYISLSASVALDNLQNETAQENDFLELITLLADTIESKEYTESGHPRRVAHYALGILEELGSDEISGTALRYGALLHDLGKINIPDTILRKTSALNEEEMTLIRKHPEEGAAMVKELNLPAGTAAIILQHHERLDGSGYPRGIKEISLGGKILAVADVFDAMNSDKVYREKTDPGKIYEEMMKSNQLDKECIEALFRYLKRNQ